MEERTYGWGINPRKEDKTRCIEGVVDHSVRFGLHHQCSFKRGHGKDGMYCKRHAKLIAKREADEKKCRTCEDTGHYTVHVPTKFHCDDCKTGCADKNCKAKS